MVDVIIHIGIPKTGTTTIQTAFYTNRVLLREHGIDYSEIGLYHPGRAHHVLSHKWARLRRKAKFSAAVDIDDAWDALSAYIKTASDTVFLSSEHFTLNSAAPDYIDCLSFIRDKLKGANIRIIGYIRRQDDCMESTYKQFIKGNRTSFTFERFIFNHTENLNNRFNYQMIFDRWAKVFGQQNVEARIYDPQLFVQDDLIKDIFHTIGRQKPANFDIPIERRNRSLGALAAKLFVDLQIGVDEMDVKLRNAIRRRFDEKVFERDCYNRLLSSNQRNLIMQKFEASNKILIDKYVRQSVGDALTPRSVEGDSDCFNVRDRLFSYEELLALAKQMKASKKSRA